MLKQQSGDAVVAVVGGDVQRREAVLGQDVDVDVALPHQQTRYLHTAVLSGQVQRGVPFLLTSPHANTSLRKRANFGKLQFRQAWTDFDNFG